jgi:hypothetical protein
MAKAFSAWDGATYRTATALSVWDGSAWRTVTTGWVWDGSAWQQCYGAGGGGGSTPSLLAVYAQRMWCASTADIELSWITSGTLTGWHIDIDYSVGAGWVSFATGVNPALGTKTFFYPGFGDSEIDFSFQFRLANGSNVDAAGSPAYHFPPLTC